MFPFECDTCIFRKLRKRDPIENMYQDVLLLAGIRRGNLDVFWSSASSTVNKNTEKLWKWFNLSKNIGLKGPYHQLGPYPTGDYCGYEIAYQMLLSALNKGRTNPEYTQWSTIRQLRTSSGNQIRATSQSNQTIMTLNDLKGNYSRISFDPLWIVVVPNKGCHNRTEDEIRSNKAMPTALLKKTLPRNREQNRVEWQHIRKTSVSDFSCYSAICYVIFIKGKWRFFS